MLINNTNPIPHILKNNNFFYPVRQQNTYNWTWWTLGSLPSFQTCWALMKIKKNKYEDFLDKVV